MEWKARFGRADVAETKQLKALEDENAKLKRMLADAMLNNVALNGLLGEMWLCPLPSGKLSPTRSAGPCPAVFEIAASPTDKEPVRRRGVERSGSSSLAEVTTSRRARSRERRRYRQASSSAS